MEILFKSIKASSRVVYAATLLNGIGTKIFSHKAIAMNAITIAGITELLGLVVAENNKTTIIIMKIIIIIMIIKEDTQSHFEKNLYFFIFTAKMSI